MEYEKLSDSLKIKWIENFEINNNLYTQVSGYVFNENNELLIVESNGVWTVPGGHPEEGETAIETLTREVIEEASIEINNIKYLGAVEVVENEQTYYQLRYFANASKILDFNTQWETTQRIFVPLEELHNYIKWSKGVTFSAQIESAKKVLNN